MPMSQGLIRCTGRDGALFDTVWRNGREEEVWENDSLKVDGAVNVGELALLGADFFTYILK